MSKEAKEREKEQEKLEKALREKLEEAKQGNREVEGSYRGIPLIILD